MIACISPSAFHKESIYQGCFNSGDDLHGSYISKSIFDRDLKSKTIVYSPKAFLVSLPSFNSYYDL